MSQPLSSKDFQPHLHTIFRILLKPDQYLDLTLVEVNELSSQARPNERCPFSLIFLSPGIRDYLSQRIYILEHEKLEQLDIFLVPIGPDEKGMRYEAVFN